jgi:hypothetical protein
MATAAAMFRTLASATTAGTTATVALCGAAELGNAAAPINAISHIVWGEDASRRDAVSVKYTVLGAALNAAAMCCWAAFHQIVFRSHRRRAGIAGAMARGAATAAAAYVVDYHVVPKRLTPGFEDRLSGRSLLLIYAALAAGLAIGERLASSRSADTLRS